MYNPVDYIKVPKNAPRNVVKRHIITPERFQVLLEKYPFGTPTSKLQEKTIAIFAENLQTICRQYAYNMQTNEY